jgi:hypothetical protein
VHRDLDVQQRAWAYALWSLLAACGGPKAVLRGDVVRDEQTAFRIGTLPPGWTRVASDGDLALRNERTGAVLLANARCGAATDAPLGVHANTLLIGFTDRRVVEEKLVPISGREGLEQVVEAKLDGMAVMIDSIVVLKEACLYDLVYAAPPARFEEGRDTFRRLIEGFEALGPAGRKG